MKEVAILLGGPSITGFAKQKLIEFAKKMPVICADGGANHAFSLGLTPTLIIGDNDSISAEATKFYTKKQVEIITLAKKKTLTDDEAAVKMAMQRGASNIHAFGVFDGRIDHMLANLCLLINYGKKLENLSFYGENFIAYYCGHELEFFGKEGDLVSIIPFSPKIKKVYLEGMAYSLEGQDLFFGSTRGNSNILLEPRGRIHHEGGNLLVIHYF